MGDKAPQIGEKDHINETLKVSDIMAEFDPESVFFAKIESLAREVVRLLGKVDMSVKEQVSLSREVVSGLTTYIQSLSDRTIHQYEEYALLREEVFDQVAPLLRDARREELILQDFDEIEFSDGEYEIQATLDDVQVNIDMKDGSLVNKLKLSGVGVDFDLAIDVSTIPSAELRLENLAEYIEDVKNVIEKALEIGFEFVPSMTFSSYGKAELLVDFEDSQYVLGASNVFVLDQDFDVESYNRLHAAWLEKSAINNFTWDYTNERYSRSSDGELYALLQDVLSRNQFHKIPLLEQFDPVLFELAGVYSDLYFEGRELRESMQVTEMKSFDGNHTVVERRSVGPYHGVSLREREYRGDDGFVEIEKYRDGKVHYEEDKPLDNFDKAHLRSIKIALRKVPYIERKLKQPNYFPSEMDYYKFGNWLSNLESTDYPKNRIQSFRDILFEKAIEWGKGKKLSLHSYDRRARYLHFLLTYHRGQPDGMGVINYLNNPSPEKAGRVREELRSEEERLYKFLEEKPELVEAYIRTLKKRIYTNDRDFTPLARLKMLFNPHSEFSLTSLARKYDEIVKIPRNCNYHLGIDGQSWRVSYLALQGRSDMEYLLQLEGQPHIFAVIDYATLTRLLDSGQMSEFLEGRMTYIESESENEDMLRNYDYPEDKQIGYYRVFPELYDPVVSASLGFSSLLARQLSQNYPNLSVKPAIYGFTNIQYLIKQAVREGYKEGVRVFHLDIYNHGLEEEGIAFGDNLQLIQLVEELVESDEFVGASFNISTMACFGGGFQDELLALLQEKPELAARVNLFTQSSSTALNYAASRPNVGSGFQRYMILISTYYNIYLLDGLNQGMSYGEAVLYADEKAKRAIHTDSESVIDGELM